MSDSPLIEEEVSIVPVKHIKGTFDFYANVLGFERRMISDNKTFAIVIHGEGAIHFTKTTESRLC